MQRNFYFAKYLENNGVQKLPQQNGSIERKHRLVVDIGLSIIVSAALPGRFWGEAFLSVFHIINMLPTPVLNNYSPFEKLFYKAFDYDFLKAFGCACYPL